MSLRGEGLGGVVGGSEAKNRWTEGFPVSFLTTIHSSLRSLPLRSVASSMRQSSLLLSRTDYLGSSPSTRQVRLDEEEKQRA